MPTRMPALSRPLMIAAVITATLTLTSGLLLAIAPPALTSDDARLPASIAAPAAANSASLHN